MELGGALRPALRRTDGRSTGGGVVSAPFDLDAITLARGAHDRRTDGVCVMEAVAWRAGEDHSDRPECASPVIAALVAHAKARVAS